MLTLAAPKNAVVTQRRSPHLYSPPTICTHCLPSVLTAYLRLRKHVCKPGAKYCHLTGNLLSYDGQIGMRNHQYTWHGGPDGQQQGPLSRHNAATGMQTNLCELRRAEAPGERGAAVSEAAERCGAPPSELFPLDIDGDRDCSTFLRTFAVSSSLDCTWTAQFMSCATYVMCNIRHVPHAIPWFACSECIGRKHWQPVTPIPLRPPSSTCRIFCLMWPTLCTYNAVQLLE